MRYLVSVCWTDSRQTTDEELDGWMCGSKVGYGWHGRGIVTEKRGMGAPKKQSLGMAKWGKRKSGERVRAEVTRAHAPKKSHPFFFVFTRPARSRCFGRSTRPSLGLPHTRGSGANDTAQHDTAERGATQSERTRQGQGRARKAYPTSFDHPRSSYSQSSHLPSQVHS